MACGRNTGGRSDLPTLVADLSYTQVAAGAMTAGPTAAPEESLTAGPSSATIAGPSSAIWASSGGDNLAYSKAGWGADGLDDSWADLGIGSCADFGTSSGLINARAALLRSPDVCGMPAVCCDLKYAFLPYAPQRVDVFHIPRPLDVAGGVSAAGEKKHPCDTPAAFVGLQRASRDRWWMAVVYGI